MRASQITIASRVRSQPAEQQSAETALSARPSGRLPRGSRQNSRAIADTPEHPEQFVALRGPSRQPVGSRCERNRLRPPPAPESVASV